MLPLILASMAINAWSSGQAQNAMDAAGREGRAGREAALNLSREAFDKQALDAAPVIHAGQDALHQQQLMTSDPNTYAQSPYAKFLQQQGEQGMQRAAVASGGVSGGGVLAMGKAAEDRAGAGFSTQYDRLGQMAQSGQRASEVTGNAQRSFAKTAGDIMMQGAQEQGNIGMAKSANTVNLLNQTLNSAAEAYGSYEQQKQFEERKKMQMTEDANGTDSGLMPSNTPTDYSLTSAPNAPHYNWR